MNEIVKIVASYFIVIPPLVVIALFIRVSRNRRIDTIRYFIVGGVLSLGLAYLAKHLYHDPRPFVTGHFTPLISHSNDNGFPSDHTLLSAFLGFAALRYSKRVGYSLLLVALLIGLARVAAGVHHPIDIAGSFLCAGLGVGITWSLSKPLITRVSASDDSGPQSGA